RAIQRWRWAFRRAARVFPSDRFAAREYGRYGLEAAVTWLPNALDTDIFRPPRDSQRAPWIVHASGFTAAKRFPDIVQAFADVCRTHPDAVLHVAGDGQDRPEMERLATKALGPQNVHFHGFLTKPKLAELLRRAAGFVLASDAETFGCVLMEAMACGCPVVTTRVGGIAAVVREGEGLFVDVGNVEQLAAGMRRVLDGTHGLDIGRIAWETGQRFSHAAVGRILHHEHALVSRGGGQTCAG